MKIQHNSNVAFSKLQRPCTHLLLIDVNKNGQKQGKMKKRGAKWQGEELIILTLSGQEVQQAITYNYCGMKTWSSSPEINMTSTLTLTFLCCALTDSETKPPALWALKKGNPPFTSILGLQLYGDGMVLSYIY